MIINSDLTISACDLLIEQDRTRARAETPEDLDSIWRSDPLFRKWRGQGGSASLGPITSFEEVHQHGCHLAYSVYRKDVR